MAIALDLPQTDEHLLALAASGDDEALWRLLERHRPLVQRVARRYFLPGADRDDVVQEGMIGLYRAIRGFDPAHGVGFEEFAVVCVTRQIMTAILKANRGKHTPLNGSAPLDGAAVQHALVAPIAADPAVSAADRDGIARLGRFCRQALSDLERDVLQGFLDGHTYEVIAHRLECDVRRVNNALQRARRKIEVHLLQLESSAA